MDDISSLLTQKTALIAWKDRLSSAVPTTDGSFVIGTFPSIHAANNMRDSYLMIKDINVKLIDCFVKEFIRDPSNIQAADESVYLQNQNLTLDNKISELEVLVKNMDSLI